jgi:hypothetical protein
MISFLTQANAQDQEEIPRITFGAEWSCTASFFTAYHFNYFSPDGYRYDQRGADGGATFNGEGLVHVGYNVNGKWNIALYTGFTGISAIHNAVPISFRATRLFKSDIRGDRWLAFADTGTGFSIKKEIQEMYALKLGGGYRYSLSRDTKLDLLASVRCTYTHPEIKFEHEPISNRWTNRNDAIVISATIGISVTF